MKAGIKKGDKVGILALNSIAALEIMYGVIRAGGGRKNSEKEKRQVWWLRAVLVRPAG